MDTIEKAARRLGGQAPAAPPASAAPPVTPGPRNPVGAPATGAPSVALEEPQPLGLELPSPPRSAGVRSGHVKPGRYAPWDPKRHLELDLEHLTQLGVVLPDERRSRIKEEYRHIKRPLLMNLSSKLRPGTEHRNVIMVTSAHPGEGKTFTALNLALSIASERDRTVLLIDADVVKRSLSRLFHVDEGAGLVDFLCDEQLALADVLVQTSLPSLTLLPTIASHPLSTELLASKAMEELAHELSVRYPDCIVVLDSPPLLITSEASVLSHVAGQIVMVVEAERTRQHQVKDALALVDAERVTGFVLNKTRHAIAPDYYYGYGGYGRSYHYYGDDSSSRDANRSS
ncbi:MAG: XrtA-associated tyrosine autokinase [Candidatus Competibacterales bacterium]